MKKLLLSGLVALTVACEPSLEAFHFDEMTYSPDETVFRLFAPTDAECFVLLEQDSLPMILGSDSIWTATVKGDHKGKTYQFLVDGQVSPGVFAKAVTVNGEKGVVIDIRDTNPEGWENDQPVRRQPQDIVIYEMHHRDFSVARPNAQHPGKFLALTEPWAIDHLTELGINAVHILPSYDFGSIDETKVGAATSPQPQYNWGYDPVNYNVPEGSYSTDPNDPQCRIREFKQMVQALHKVGIAVILDVVYNHTYDIEHSNFQRTYPDYYYRLKVEGGKVEGDDRKVEGEGLKEYSNGSGCGNETASEKPMMRKFMVESVKYWVNEYHIDGFRFDLMGCHDIETMNTIRKALDEIDPTLFIYGEGWSAGQCALPTEQLGVKANIPQMPRIAAFSDELRDGLRGPFDDDTKPGWLGLLTTTANSNLATTAGSEPELTAIKIAEESIKFGIAGGIAHPQVDMAKVNYSKAPWATEPTQMLSYVSCHDDMCLVDRLQASIPGCSLCSGAAATEALIRLDLLAQTAVFTSQGVPFMLSGEELLRTKQGVHNSFESPDSINQLNWSNKEKYPQVFAYYKNLIALRKNHPAFRLGTADLVRQHLEFLDAPIGVVAFRLKNCAALNDWPNIIVILNANPETATVNIPEGTYTVVCREGQINEQGIDTAVGSSVAVTPRSALILHDF
jgi:pullulanase